MKKQNDISVDTLLSKKMLLDIFVEHRVHSMLPGDWESILKGAGYEFWGLREMGPLDSGKNIDWKATARSGVRMVREYLAESYTNLMILFDVSHSMAFGNKRLLQANIAASLAYTAAATNNPCGLIFFSDHVLSSIPPKMGWDHFYQLIVAICQAQPVSCEVTNINPALATLVQDVPESLTFMLSDFLYPLEFQQYFVKSRMTFHDVKAVQVIENYEAALPSDSKGLISLKDLETGKTVTADLSRWENYNTSMRRHQEILKDQFTLVGFDWICVTPSESFSHKINALMKGDRINKP